MQEKYEFTFQISYDDILDVSKKLALKSVVCKVNSINYMLAIMSFIFMGHIFGSFFDGFGHYITLISLIMPVWYYLNTQKKIKNEYLRLPILSQETTITISRLNIQDSCGGNLIIIPYKNAEFVETNNSFGFIFNLAMLIPVPKNLFKTPAEADEFRAFVLQNY